MLVPLSMWPHLPGQSGTWSRSHLIGYYRCTGFPYRCKCPLSDPIRPIFLLIELFLFSVYRLSMTTQNSDWSKFLLIEVSCSRCTGHAEFWFVQLFYLLKFLCIGVSASLSGDLIPLGSDWSYLLLIEMLVFQVKFEYVMRGGSRVGVLFNMMTAELIWPESVFPTIYS